LCRGATDIQEVVLSDNAVRLYRTEGYLYANQSVVEDHNDWRATMRTIGVPHYNGSHVNYLLEDHQIEASIRVGECYYM